MNPSILSRTRLTTVQRLWWRIRQLNDGDARREKITEVYDNLKDLLELLPHKTRLGCGGTIMRGGDWLL